MHSPEQEAKPTPWLCNNQLLKIADHYEIVISDRRLKDTVKSILKANLYDMKVLSGVMPGLAVLGLPH